MNNTKAGTPLPSSPTPHRNVLSSGWGLALGLFILFSSLSAATFWNVLSDPEQVLAFNDGSIEIALSPTFHFPEALFRIWDNQFFLGQGMKQYMLSVSALGECIGQEFWRRGGQAFLLALCGLAFYWALRQYKFNRAACIISASIAMLSGWSTTFAITGLAIRPTALACTALALGYMERGRQRQGWLDYAIAGGCLGLGIAEVPDVGALLAIASALVFFWTHMVTHGITKGKTLLILTKFTLYVAFSALLAWQTIGLMFNQNIKNVTQGSSENPKERYAWATQWSIPPQETWNLLSGNYFGCSMRSEEYPYWGRAGRSEGWEQTRQGFRNFTMTGYHVGVLPFVLLLALFFYARKKESVFDLPLLPPESQESYPAIKPRSFTLLIFVGWMLSLMLMWGKYFPLYQIFWSLPFISTFRNPDKWAGPFTLFTILGVALMLDICIRHLKQTSGNQEVGKSLRNALLTSASVIGGIGLIIWLGTAGAHDSFVKSLGAEGYGALAEVAWNNSVAACIKVVVFCVIFSITVLWVFRIPESTKARGSKQKNNEMQASSLQKVALIKYPASLFALIVLGMSAADLCLNNHNYALGHKYRQYLQANPLTDFLDAHRTEGRIKLLPPQNPLLNNLRLTQLQIKGYDLFDPVSVSRMPTDYEALFNALSKQPIRLWELGAIRYFLTLPGALDQLNGLDGNQNRFKERLALGVGVVNDSYLPLATDNTSQRYLRLVEFTGALPKYRLVPNHTILPDTPAGDLSALQILASSNFNVKTVALIHSPLTVVGGTLSNEVALPQFSVTVASETPTDTKLSVETDRPAILVRSAKFDNDWKGTLNAKPTPLYRANYLFQAVEVPVGKHTIEFAYSPSVTTLYQAFAARLMLLIMIAVSACLCRQPRPLAAP